MSEQDDRQLVEKARKIIKKSRLIPAKQRAKELQDRGILDDQGRVLVPSNGQKIVKSNSGRRQ